MSISSKVLPFLFVCGLEACSLRTSGGAHSKEAGGAENSESSPSGPTTKTSSGAEQAESRAALEDTPHGDTTQRGTSRNVEKTSNVAQKKIFPAGTKVLHVGDSFAGALGLPLGERLEAAGVSSVLKHTDSSYLTTWAWEGDLQKYLWKYNPDLVIVTLGANELGIAQPEQREKTVKKIIATIGDRPCLWVAIPLWKGKQNGLMDVIKRSVAPCTYMDTNELLDVAKMPRIADGIHPTTAARADWAEFVIGWLKEHRNPSEDRPWALRP